MSSSPIYFDNNSTTALDPKVYAVVAHTLQKICNPSSSHRYGREARSILLHSKQVIADHFCLSPQDILFTSGATEAVNLVLRGLLGNKGSRAHLIYSALEHSVVTSTAAQLKKNGCELTELPACAWGAITAEAIEAAIRPTTQLIVVMAANNETGVKSDLEAIASVAERHGIPLFVDAVAWMGKEKLVIPRGVSGFCFSGHKFHGPLGAGCLVWRRSWNELEPLITGGSQQYSKRAGTENLPAIAGLAAAVECLQGALEPIEAELTRLRNLFESLIFSQLSDVVVNGLGPRISNTSNLAFLGVDGESLLACLDTEGVAVSHGSACSAGALEPSRVLLAMGLERKRVESSIRFSFSRMTTEEEVVRGAEIVVRVVKRLRNIKDR